MKNAFYILSGPQAMVEQTSSDDEQYRIAASRRRFLGATAGASLAALGTGTAAAATSDPAVTIVHDTHFHGRFGEQGELNIARYQTAIRQQLSGHDNAIFLGNGDDLSPSLLGLVFKGEHMVDALNFMHAQGELRINGAGNHEFDFGVDNATTRFQNSNFPWVIANLLTPDGNPIPGTERWTTTDVNGTTVGVFGCGVENFHEITSFPDDYQVLDPVEASKEAVDALAQQGADVIVLASHTNHDTHLEIAEQVDGLDAIVGSHSDVVMDAPLEKGGTIISEVGDEFDHLGVVELDATGDLLNWTRVDVKDDPPDATPGMLDIMEKWNNRLEERFGKPIATVGEELDARFATNFHVESRVGNLITDAMRWKTGADIAIQNAGGIRSNTVYPRGPITTADVLNILPFGNTLVTLRLTGEELIEALASQVVPLESDAGQAFGAEPSQQVSGIRFEWVGHEDVDETDRIRNAYVNDEPLDPDADYAVTVNSFMAGGGTGYPLDDKPRLAETTRILGLVVADYLEAQKHVLPVTSHRMERVDVDVGESRDIRDENRHSAVSVVFDEPDDAAGFHPSTFAAVTQFGESVQAEHVEETDGEVAVRFDDKALGTLASGPKDIDLRVYGGYDSESFGESKDIQRVYFFDSIMRGQVQVPGGLGVRNWWNDNKSNGKDTGGQ